MFKKPFTFALLVLAFVLQPVFPALAMNASYYAAQPLKHLSISDTLSGMSTKAQVFDLESDLDYTLAIETPTQSVIKIPATTDLFGEDEIDIYPMQIAKMGRYCGWLIFSASQVTERECFEVYPGQMSPYHSRLYADKQLADVGEQVTITVEIKDEYGNPIPNQTVVIGSSNSADRIESVNGVNSTDGSGRVHFFVTGTEENSSVFTAHNLGTGDTLEERLTVAFRPRLQSNVGGNIVSSGLLNAQLFDAGDPVLAGPIDRFEIVGLPNQAIPGEFFSFEVWAVDSQGTVTPNYQGNIILSTANDESAVLPDDYSFTVADQGKATFNLAASFSQPGTQEIVVLDSGDWNIVGSAEIDIVQPGGIVPGGSNGSNNPPVDSQGLIEIKSPTNGSAYGSGMVTLTGQGPILTTFDVFLDGQKLEGQGEVDVDGFFTYELTDLSNGSHDVFLMSNQTASETVSFVVDKVPPGILSTSFQPDGPVMPGAAIQVVIVTDDPELESARIRFQGVEVPLAASSDPGNYSTTLAAPTEPGNYTVDVTLVDALGNSNVMLGVKTITVQPMEEVAPPVINVPTPQGFNGQPLDGGVVLSWNADPAASFLIEYGTSFSDLNQSVQAPGSPFVVTGLQNTQYFFSVTAIIEGQQSAPSIILALSPEAEEVEVVETPPVEQPPVDIPPVEETPVEFTPPVQIPPVTELFPTAQPEIQVSALGSGAILEWSPNVLPPFNQQAFFYRVFFGFESGQYIDFVTTEDNEPSLFLENLIPDITYYGRIVALGIDGQEVSQSSDEFTFTSADGGVVLSGGGGFDVLADLGGRESTNAVPLTTLNNADLTQVPEITDAGSNSLWVVLLSLLVGHFLYMHKKKWLKS